MSVYAFRAFSATSDDTGRAGEGIVLAALPCTYLRNDVCGRAEPVKSDAFSLTAFLSDRQPIRQTILDIKKIFSEHPFPFVLSASGQEQT